MARNALTNDEPTLFIDQWGGQIVASSRKELKEKVGGGSIQKQFMDKKNGPPVWNGYVVNLGRNQYARWFTAFKCVEVPV